ncbi:MAG: hypothetical protein ISQ19_02130 [PS1 clade bacterium]|uniref:Uncharacterized protein n=1 Tax=PS1 clade bacterium TaxID=2175152 RepID=A0A937L3E8_9PROT|nr:hypothetical protein [PS1 clade bacterium]
MADEESEIRRMAEIADAINAILDADPVGDTPAQGASVPRNDTASGASQKAGEEAASDAVETTAQELPDDLDAAIASIVAEPGDDNGVDYTDPAPQIDATADAPINNEIGREVRAGSQMAELSVRMQSMLAEIRAGNALDGPDNKELLAQIEAARDAIVASVRGKIDALNSETAARKQAILEQFEQLERQNSLIRDELEFEILKFEDELKQMQQKYFKNAANDGDRLDRYREFLKYLLSERGTNID